jgi:hypothetical protein
VIDLSSGGFAPYAPALPFGLNLPAKTQPDLTPPRDPGSALPNGAKKNDYLIIRPRPDGATTTAPSKPAPKSKDGGAAPPPPKVAGVAPPQSVRPGQPVFGFDPFADRRPEPRPVPAAPPAAAPPAPPVAKTDTPEPDAAAEANRQVKLGVHAFATEKFGQAAEHFDQALRLRPDDAVSHFMKGQAQFAAGQYAEAVSSIRDGLKLAPDWPAGEFKPKDLYVGKPARFDADVAALRKAAADNPDEPALQFLLAYQLWFSGDRPEAAKLFRTVAGKLKDPAVVARFLKEAERK